MGGHGDCVPLREHLEALRAADDRRYAEVAAERQKAADVRERADEKALSLAREAQQYRDEQANRLREQIQSERGLYATQADLRALSDRFDVAHKPVVEFMAAQAGRADRETTTRLNVNTVVQVLALLAVAAALIWHR